MKKLSILIVIGTFLTPVAIAQSVDDLRVLNVEGHGMILAEPDQAVISFGSTSQAKKAEDAIESLAEITAAANAVIITAGIAEDQIETRRLNVSPVYRDSKIIAFEASNHTDVTVDDLDLVPNLLGALGAAGVNQINGVEFKLAEPKAVADQALLAAIDDAEARAQAVADRLGVALGTPVTVDTNTGGPIYPMQRDFAVAEVVAFDGAAKAVPISAGDVSIEANVNITYEIGPK